MKEAQRLEKLLSKGKITRRDFMAKMSALGLAAAVSPALLTQPAKAATPQKGGKFIMGLTGGHTTDNLDTGTLSDEWNYNTNWMYRNCLVEVDYQGNPTPELAEKWESTPDAKTWIFDLKQGIEFHNGKTLDAQDVIFSINHHRGDDSKSAAKGIVDQITDIKADGKYRVIFELNGGNADFPFIASDYHLTIQPADTGKGDWIKGIGTGAYIQSKFEPGVVSAGKRNPNFFKQDRAHFDEVEMLVISDAGARTNALKTNAIHLMTDVDVKTVHLLDKIPGIHALKATGTFHNTIPMHVDVPPFDNKDARLGLKYAIDREQLVKLILKGYGTVGNDHPIAPIDKFHHKELPQRQYDPDKARFHLKKAGLENYKFKLHSSDLGNFTDTAVLYSEHAKKAGINIEVVHHPTDGYWEAVWLKEPWCMCYWNGRATADWMFSTAYSGDAKWNDSHFKHKRFDELLVAARAELDDAKRREMYWECQEIVSNEGGVIVPFFADWVIAANDKMGYENVAGNWNPDGARAAERWWFKA